MVDCNDELTDALGNRMTDEEFSEKYNSILEDYTRDSLNEQGNEDASNGEWDEEFEFQKDKFLDANKIVIID